MQYVNDAHDCDRKTHIAFAIGATETNESFLDLMQRNAYITWR